MSDIIEKIEKYFNSSLQYPLLLVVSSDDYQKAIDAFSATNKIRVSDYCIGPDKDPDVGKMLDDIKELEGNHILIGLGEFLASKEDVAKNLLLPYKDLFLHPKCRVAVLLSAHMYLVAKDIISGDIRAKSHFVLPKSTPDIPIVDRNAFVYGIKAYLEACEKGEPAGVVRTERNISNVTVVNPNNAYEELKHKYPNEFSRIQQETGTDENWGSLLEAINKNQKTVRQYLSEQNFTAPEYIFLDYAKRRNYKSFLYLLWLKLYIDSRSYLCFVAIKTKKLDELLEIAKTAILDVDISEERFTDYYDQRKTILKNCNDSDMADYTVTVQCRGKERIAYLTDNTKVERKAIIKSLCDGAKSDYVKTNYPDLYYYLQDYKFDDTMLTDYFAAYKRSKVFNRIDDTFYATVSEHAINRPYNSFPSRASVFTKMDKNDAYLIFLDALGVEFLGYIKQLCSAMELRFVTIVARAELPTITAHNKEFYDSWEGKKETPIKDLDELKHHPERGYDYNNSKYPIHLVEELEVVREALDRAKEMLSTGECRKVVIASDHGASRLAVIHESEVRDSDEREVKANGRYCQGTPSENEPMIVSESCSSDYEYAIIADYSRYSGSRSGSVEVHGGATLEEVLVPVIELTLINKRVQVSLEADLVETSYNIEPELIFIITPDYDSITASINGVDFRVEKLEQYRYKVLLSGIKKGKHTLDVFENQNKLASKEFTVKSKGFAERDLI